jgi:hypothetical protein
MNIKQEYLIMARAVKLEDQSYEITMTRYDGHTVTLGEPDNPIDLMCDVARAIAKEIEERPYDYLVLINDKELDV